MLLLLRTDYSDRNANPNKDKPSCQTFVVGEHCAPRLRRTTFNTSRLAPPQNGISPSPFIFTMASTTAGDWPACHAARQALPTIHPVNHDSQRIMALPQG